MGEVRGVYATSYNGHYVYADIEWNEDLLVTVNITSANSGWDIKIRKTKIKKCEGGSTDRVATFYASDGTEYVLQVYDPVVGNYVNNGEPIFAVTSGDSDEPDDGGGSSSTTISGFTAKDICFGDRVSVTWTPPSSSFAYELKFKINGSDIYVTDVLTPDQTTPYTYTGYSIPVSCAKYIPDSDHGTVTVKLTQYSNSDASQTVGSSIITTFGIRLKDDVVPEIISCSAQLNNDLNPVVASWGIGLAGYSKINLIATASGAEGSTIKNFTINGDYSTNISGSSLDYTGPVITTSGNKSFTITCTDSRGRTSTAVMTNLVEIQPYTKPKVTAISYNKTDQGYISVTAAWEYASLGGLNSVNAGASYRQTSSANWIDYPESIENNQPFVISKISLDGETSYSVRVVVTDLVGSRSEKSTFASTTRVLLDFKAGGRGLGIGKVCEEDGMEVSMDATFYEGVYVRKESDLLSLEDYIKSVVSAESVLQTAYPVGGIYISLDSRNPELILGFGKWSQICGRFLLGAGVNKANTVNDFGSMPAGVINRGVGEMGGEVFHELTVDEMPQHRHGGVRRRNVGEESNGSTGVSSGDGVTTYDTDYAGGDTPHNNMPPYLAVYMWERVA